jgi:hypothetical protein
LIEARRARGSWKRVRAMSDPRCVAVDADHGIGLDAQSQLMTAGVLKDV